MLRSATTGLSFRLRSITQFMADAGLGSNLPGTATDQWRRIERSLRVGAICVVERSRELSRYTDEQIVEPDSSPPPAPPEPLEPLDRSLIITRCDPALASEPLRFTYLLRELAGRPVTLRVISDSFPGRVVYQRALSPSETADGAHNDTWDGRVTHPGEQAPRRLAAEYGPCLLELEHNSVYRDEAGFVIAEPDYIVEFADLHFATNRELLLPLADPPEHQPDTPRAAPLHVIAAALEFAADHPEREIVVYGHTDTAGAAGHNDNLSEERARTVALYLAGDREAWAAHAQEHHQRADFKRVHRWAAERFAWATDPGSLGNEWNDAARRARAEFRRRCNELLGTELAQGVKQNVNDWLAIFDLYDVAVSRYLECEPRHLPALRAAISFAEPAIISCGEHWPVVMPDQDGVTERLNRRVEVMFFQPGELPAQHGGEDPPGDEIYASGRYQQVRLGTVSSDEALLRITLLDEHADPMPSAKYEVNTRAGPWTGVADADGVASIPRALVDTSIKLLWAAPDDEQQRYWSNHDLATDGETDEGVLRRLANLGFDGFGDPEHAVIKFQRFLGIPPTGKFEDVAELVNDWYVAGRRPEPNPEDYDWPEQEPDDHDHDHDHGHDHHGE
ncbi:hypothetical protein DB30_03396 [Enhygromyxa salina]|uniref:OmpA-like domain-containing protein n=1 Tax=Enhygromyxa salina TaxID=215803 RepID=A0A0C1ZIH7_9BACT|nr:hypothetical protein DB30_03396 [Enhygromyxa salina]